MAIPIQEIEQELVENFSLFDSWDDKYEYLIELGKKLPALDSSFKTDDYKIKGCQSSVWVVAKGNKDEVIFDADSDSVIVKGLASLLVQVLSGQKASDIVDAKLEFIDAIGMNKHLAQTRSNGLLSMIKQVKMYAFALQNS